MDELTVAWLDGGLVDARRAGIALDDHGLTTGDGCFETVAVRDGAPFVLGRHLARLARSCAGLGVPAPDGEHVRTACRAVLDAAGPAVGRLRITVTSGRGPLASGRGRGEPTLVVLPGTAPRWPSLAAAAVCPWHRNERSPLAGLKTTSYAENVVALAWAEARGCDEALFANTRGQLCEGTGTNVFVVTGGRLATPPLDAGCLAGVTRGLVLEHVEADERTITMDELAAADEVVLTSTTRGVHPVGVLDGRPLAAPGPVTRRVLAAWSTLTSTSLEVQAAG